MNRYEQLAERTGPAAPAPTRRPSLAELDKRHADRIAGIAQRHPEPEPDPELELAGAVLVAVGELSTLLVRIVERLGELEEQANEALGR